MTKNNAQDLVEFWFDAVCPWTWITSRWMADVNNQENLNVQWQPFSLKILNEGKENNKFKEGHDNGFRLGQLFTLVKGEFGNEKVGELYKLVGEKIFLAERDDIDAIIEEALSEASLPASLADRIHGDESERLGQELAASTARGISLVGPGVGIPIVAINEEAFFGPVISPAPKGQDALNLWQAVSLSIKTPGFSELKRGRSGGLSFE